jgi:hypothetical protein
MTKRTAPDAHEQMREVTVPLLGQFIARWPEVFEDLGSLPQDKVRE